jgi:hypothetical protein
VLFSTSARHRVIARARRWNCCHRLDPTASGPLGWRQRRREFVEKAPSPRSALDKFIGGTHLRQSALLGTSFAAAVPSSATPYNGVAR